MPGHRVSRSGSTKARTSRQKSTALTCRGCRTKKIRCDGKQPSCGICVAYDDECHYDKVPPMSQVLAMTDRIAELERIVHNLQQAAPHTALQPLTISSGGDEASQTTLGDGQIEPLVSSTPLVTSNNATLDREEAYYETTSAVHNPETVRSSLGSSDNQSYQLPTMTPEQLAYWDARVAETASLQLNLSPSIIRHLLDIHWTWVHPTFMFVNRETFLRDAATGGEYCSPLLLSVICLHSTRFTDHHLSEELLARCNLLLGQEIPKGGSITTAQALLQLSAREVGNGNLSQGWLYSGMASRICIELGLFSRALHIPTSAAAGEIRRGQVSHQLAWSCYLWDKVISLYFGRSPSLPEPPLPDGQFDTSVDEGDVWHPHKTTSHHPGAASHKIACFLNLCKLAVIITEILLNIYGRPSTNTVVEFVQKTQHKLSTWRSQSPSALVMDPNTRPEVCPPQHILSQNLLYYTTIILLHRPFKNNNTSRSTCREAAASVENILLLREEQFGLDNCTYLMCYCAYTAATVAVQDTRDGIPGACERLDTCLRALRATKASCPGIQRSIDIIAACVDSYDKSTSTTEGTSTTTSTGRGALGAPLAWTGQMPAFPHNVDQWNLGLSGLSTEAFESAPQSLLYLDSFPQESYGIIDGAFEQFNFSIP